MIDQHALNRFLLLRLYLTAVVGAKGGFLKEWVMEWIAAFLIIFASVDMPDEQSVPVFDHARKICQAEYPKGRVRPHPDPVYVGLAPGIGLWTDHVFVCERQVTKKRSV